MDEFTEAQMAIEMQRRARERAKWIAFHQARKAARTANAVARTIKQAVSDTSRPIVFLF